MALTWGKTYGNIGGNGNGNISSRRPDEPGDGGGGGGEDREMTDSICDNSALLSGHDSENMDYGNNNRMNSESAETGTTDDQNTEIQGFSYTEGSSNDPTMSTSETNPSYPEVVLNPDNASSDSILGHV
ncbi:hypothetical protein C0J52_07133 [Blattella germanica]|nr:hypothetical protein C0J52_07133 [Blattella germanica]